MNASTRRFPWPRVVAALVVMASVIGGEVPSAQAVQIKRIYSDTINFDIDDVVKSVTIAASVNQTKSIILLSDAMQQGAANMADQHLFFTAQFEDNDTIVVERAGATNSSAAVVYQVVEFEDGVSVQRGITSFSPGTLTKSITIPTAISTTKAVPIIQARSAETGRVRTDQYFYVGTFPNSTTLQLDRTHGTATAKAQSLTWQVIEFLSDATVQTGTTSLAVCSSGCPNTNQASTVTPATTLNSNGANAMLFFQLNTGTAEVGVEPRFYTRGNINTSGQLVFTREYAPNTANTAVTIRYYVVDFQELKSDGTPPTTRVPLGYQQKGAISGSHTASAPATKAITNITDGSPITVTVASHGWANGDLINIDGVPAANSNAAGSWVIGGVTTNTFTLTGSTTIGATTCTTGCGNALPSVNTGLASTNPANRQRSQLMLSAEGGGTTSDNLGDDFAFVGFLTSNTNLATSRYSSARNTQADLEYLVYEFQPLTLKSPNGGEVWKVAETTRSITWKHAKDLESGGTCGGGSGPGHKLKIELSVNSGTSYLGTTLTSNVCANLDTWAWNPIPASVGGTDIDVATLRVKITDLDIEAAYPTIADNRKSDASNENFEIKGQLAITAPNTNLTWYVGDTTRNITWTKDGNLDDNGSGATQGKVQFELWKNSGTTFDSNITPGTGTGDPLASALTYAWNPIPDKIGTGYRVKVKHLADTTGITDFSDVDFTIKGTLTVTYPNASGVTLETQKSYNITWNKTGTFPAPGGGCTQTDRVDLYYSTGGPFSNAIATCQAAGSTSGSYSWSVPTSAVGTFTRVRVQQAGDVTVYDDSDNDFTVVASIVVTAPNSGTEVWSVGSSQNITWTINGTGINNVKLEYSTGGCGGSFTQIVASTGASAGTYPWTIPDAIGGNTCVRVSNVDVPAVLDTSNTPFRIKGAVHVLVPNGGQTWAVGSSQNVQWENLGTVSGTVTLLYSTTGGSSYPNTIASGVAIGALSQPWTIPDAVGGTVRVKIAPSDTTNVAEDESDANFSIKGSVTLTAPNGGGTCTVNQTCQVTWTKTGAIGNVELHYSTDGGATFPAGKLIATGLDPVTGTPYAWTTPDDIDNDIRVRVRLVSDPAVEDQSNANFAIKGTVTMTAPNNGEVWKVGETIRSITWDRVGTTGSMAGNVELHYATDGVAGTYNNQITPGGGAANTGSYSWNPIPDAIGTQVSVRVRLVGDTSVSDTSNANFTIKGQLAVTAPNTNLIWFVGDTARNITWSTNGTVANVKLYYATDGTTFSNAIAGGASISNVGSYNWNPIPDIIGTNVKVKVENAADTTVYDESDVSFTVKGTLTVTAPNGAETWIVGDTQNITWNKTGNLSGNVKVLYSTDGGATYPDPGNMITNSVAVTAGSYAWTVPNTIDNDIRIKIIYLNDTAVTDESDANFTILGSLNVTAPDGGEVWELGTAQTITWNFTGTLGDVKLEYSTNSGATFPNVIVNSTPSDTNPPTGANNGQYAWTIPTNAPLSTTARVRVTPVTAGKAAANASENDFRLKGKLTVTAPNGGQTWVVGTPENITWSTVGAIANAKLEYSTDGGSTWPAGNVIIASTPAGAGSYAWTVADGIGIQARIRISDASDSSVVDTSDANFTIKGSLALTAPNGGQAWVVGTTQNVTWTKTGTLPNVRLDYSINSGVAYPNLIVTSTPGAAGSYAWTIPDAIGTLLRVKVTYDTTPDTLDLSDTSDADFTIKGSLTITAPNGNEGWAINGSQNITWTKTGTLTGLLKLEYSTDGGLTYPVGNLISALVAAADTSYAWTIPDNPATQARVKVTQLLDTSVFDQSDANFSIKGSLFITAPNGGEVWKVGESRNVTWTRGGSIANAKLDLSKDGGATFPIAITASTPAANLSYAWTIPDEIDTDLRVRITDVGDNTVTDASDANFTIKGSLVLTAPNGGETWIVNESRNVTWTKTGTIPNVKLEYSVNGGAAYPSVIVASTPGASLSYAWTVPDAIGTQLRVKMTNVDDATVTDASNANFTVKGALALTSPNGGETWIVNESRNVTWTKQGSIANVKLEYSKNGFADELQTFTIVASTAAAPLSYAWTVADAIGTALKVRVSDALDATVNDASNATFTIKGALLLTAPNGGQAWTVLSSQNVTWTRTGSITNVKLEYSTDSGSTYPNLVTASTDAATGTYAWTIPDNLTATAKVRVTDTGDASVQDESNAVFKIVGSLTLTAPNGSEKWTVATSQNVTWTKVGAIANAKLEYSTDGGSTYPNTIIASTAASALSYAWTIPNTPTATAKVRISDVNDATVLDVSNADFKIKAGLTLTAPNGGEVWTAASAQNVTWTTVGTAANVTLAYSTDGGSTYPNVISASSANTGSYSWTVADAISTTVRVKVSVAGDADAFDTSDTNFKIRGALLLTAPNGGEGWQITTAQDVTWTRTGSLPNVKLEYSTNGFSNELQTYVIIASTPADPAPADNNGTYAWTIPNTPSTSVKVRASDASDSTVNDLSNATFSIKGSLTLMAPNSGEVWVVGSVQNITWNVFGAIANVKLQYSTDGGSTWPGGNLIIASTPANTDPPVGADNGQYSWTIPDAISTQMRVRVSDAADASVLDDSNANFKIKGSMVLTAPNGGETWIVGASQNITWTKTGSFANVKLEYSTNGGATYPNLITASTAAAPLSFAWTVPDAIGTQLRVQASDAADATVVDTSNGDFEIKSSLTLTSPNGGELWKVGESRNVTWTKTGTIATVKLEYSTNGGTSFPNVIATSVNASTGTPYAWTVPDAIDNDLRVKVTNNADAAVNDASNANFEVKGQLTLGAPNGGEVWTVNASQNITWTKQGTFSTVKLEYSTDGGSTYPNLIAGTVDAVTGTPYAWTVPDAIGTQLRVKVTNNADNAVTDASDANFKIAGSLTLIAPNGSEVWTVGTSQNVTWTRVGSITNAKLEYSVNGGTSYPNLIIASTGAGAGAYTWTIPDAIGTTLRVKITDASDATVNDASNGNFKILGGFTLTAPNSGEVWTVGASENITWTTAGSISNVKLEYSTDSGSTYPNTINASTSNTGTFAWTIPDAISTTVRVKVSDAADAAAFDTSNANFKIRGSLLLTAPNGGEAWPIATSQNVTWTKTGSIVNAKLEYSTDGGTSYPNLIVASTSAASLSYAWTMPSNQNATARVRISDVADSTVLDTSDANFKIKGVLALTAPNGGETWIVGTGYNITWTKQGAFIANVELRYSIDGGSTYPAGKVIIASTAADTLSYNWTIPDDIANTVRVRVTDLTDTSVLDDSNGNFSIKGSLAVSAPNGGEVWVVSDSQNVTWTKTGTIANVKLEYSKNGFADELQTFQIVASVASTPASYAWTIPDAISGTVKVRVSNVADASVYDVSNATFSIKGSVAVNSPNGGETWIVGASQPVTWSRVGSIANVKLEYSTDGGVSYPNVIVASTAASAGSYSWTIPDAITTTARVKVTDALDAAVFDASNANFKIAGSLTLGAPNGGNAWLIGTSQNIVWTKTGTIANVKLEYSTNGGSTYPNLIIASVDATTGTPYAWTIPDAPTTQARVKVTNTADALVFDESNGNFNIRGSVTLTSPNGGEVLVVGSSENITWTRTGSFANVELRYSTDSGATYPNVIVASTAAGALSYACTIPDAISTTVRIKITDTGDSAVTDTSNADFKIKGSVTVTAPNGAEVWIVGASQNITWTRTGSFANVKLEYSTNGGTSYPNVINLSAPAGPLSYAWTIPDAIGTQLRVKISDAADAAGVTDASDANFTVKGSLTLNAPNGGETWIVGTSQNITWAKTGTITSAKLEYSTDGGSTYPNVINASVSAAALTYAWTIPDSISSTVRVKITSLADATVADASNANLKIAGSLTLTSPDGGEVWLVGATQNITWTKTGSIATAKLEYSTDGGVSYPNVITTSVAGSALSFAWTVPDNMSSTVKVKLTDNSDAAVTDASSANFKIAGSFVLTAPNGAEKWPAGSIQSVTWTKTGSIVNAKLEYSTDGGSTFPNLIVATTPANALSYAWTLGATTSTQVRVRIADVADATVYDVSNANFKIMGGFTLSAPNGGEVWVVGASQNITWATVGNVANVKLTYSVNGGTTYPNTINGSTANTGSYSWTIPDAIGTTLKVKVEDVLDVDAFDESNANFKIKGSLTVTAPNGAEIWSVQSSQNITWTKTGSIANVKLEYSTDGGSTYPGANLIAAAVNAATGTPYAWTIPDAITTTVRIKVTDVTDATVMDESNTNFTIRGSFTLTAPNGSEKWTVGTTQSITWTTFGTIPNVKLEYSTDGGSTFPNVITASSSNTGSYNWSIPNAISAAARVRVSNAADPGTLDTSNADFKIKAGFTLTSPDGGEVLVVGASHSVTWTTAGTVSNVKLEYSTNSGSSYPNVITNSVSNSGTYNWTVPDAISATVRVRVSDATDTVDAFDTSNGNFKIRAGFTLSAPNGGEAWVVGGSQNVAWASAGTVANVKLEYSTDGGSSYPNVIVASVANTSPYAWTIPDAITIAARVRISDINDVTASDTSNANFKIQGSLTMTAPNGGEKWTVGSARNLTWDRVGSISFVKLEFSTNSGSIYSPITTSTSNTGSYSWTVPDTISTNCLVKVTDVNDATVNDVSNATFKIQAGFTVTTPNGGEVWGVGSARTVSWTTNGTVSFVAIDYSTDSGTTFPNQITTSTSNTGSFNWTVPDTVTGGGRVRVSQTTDAEAFDTSNGNFRIRAAFTLSAPNGAEHWRVGQSRNIAWSVVGTIPNVKLQYSRDNFNADLQTIAASAPNTSPYAWTIPDAISNTVRVRVSDPNDIGALDDSNADFRITGDFAVTAPNGGEQWLVGTSYNITWTKTGSVTNAKIEYSLNSGGSWTTIAGLTPNDGDFAWTVPDTITAQGRMQLSDPADATATDMSDADFKIKANFTLSAPNGGEVWDVGISQSITWTNTGTVPNVKLTYSTNGGTSYPNVISSSVGNAGSYNWSMPDAISTTVRVKVESTTDTDAFDTSNANFKIRGRIRLTAPNGLNEPLPIAQNYNISWLVFGTIPNLKLTYSTDGGATFPSLINASVPSGPSTFYGWMVPDSPTTAGRVKIEDPNDATVFDTSDNNFRIHGNFTLTAPNGGETWEVGGVNAITWNWGGTIPNVKLEYSTDGGATYPNVIVASTPNGSGSSGSFSYNWTVPDAISTTVRVKVTNPADTAVFDASNANFKIAGKLTLTAPNGGETWIINDNRGETGAPLVNYSLIKWTSAGTMPTVRLEYSTDGGATYPNVIAASVANAVGSNTYNWRIPSSLSSAVKVRVVNTADTGVLDVSDAVFTIGRYTVTFRVRDLLSNAHLDQIGVSGGTPTLPGSNPAPDYQWADSGLNSAPNGIVTTLPYGSWQVKFSRVAYGDQVISFTMGTNNQIIDVFMETQVVHIWEAVTEFAYVPPVTALPNNNPPIAAQPDSLAVTSTLRRDGSTVPGAVSCTVKIYDGATEIKNFTQVGAPNAQGFYSFSWSPTTLVAGKVYNVVTTASIITGGTFNTPRTLTVNVERKLQDVQHTVNERLDTSLTAVKTDVKNVLKAQLGFTDDDISAGVNMKSELAGQKTAIQQKLQEFSGQVASSIVSLENAAGRSQVATANLEDAANKSQAAAKELEKVGKKYGARLLLPPTALMGETVTLRYRTGEKLAPIVDIYTVDKDGKTVVIARAVPMPESTTNPGLYEYSLRIAAESHITPGKPFTVFVQEPSTGNLEAGSVFVESTSLSSLEGLIASGSGMKPLIQQTFDAISAVKGTLATGGDVTSSLELLKTKVDRIPRLVAQEGGTVQMRKTVNDVAQTIKQLAGDQGFDFSQLVKKGIEDAPSLKSVRKKTDEIQGATEVMQILMEQKLGGKDDPVVHVTYE